jgi:hypothetical protein
LRRFENGTLNGDATAARVYVIPMWARVLLAVMFLLVVFSFGVIAFLIGRTGEYDGYSGRIINTITIGASKPGTRPADQTAVNVRGRVIYEDGRAFEDGMILLFDELRQWTAVTDENGMFEFAGVTPGGYTIEVYRDGALAATSFLQIDRGAGAASSALKIDDENHYIVASIEVPVISIVIDLGSCTQQTPDGVRQYGMTITLEPGANGGDRPGGDTQQPEPIPTETRPPQTSRPPAQESEQGGGQTTPGGEQTPGGTDSETTDDTGDTGDSGDDSGGTGAPDEAPGGFFASQGDNPDAIWTGLTQVDLFAERPGNFGVSTIDGKNVIAPGSHGSFIFRVENTERFAVRYDISFIETDENVPHIPMIYRLKRGVGGTDYIGGAGWKNADRIALANSAIAADSEAFYTLEWKWDPGDSAINTAIGTQGVEAFYVLNIVISAQFI